MNRSPEFWAAGWHYVDAGLISAAFIWGLVGLYGHYRLRKSYQRWHACQPV